MSVRQPIQLSLNLDEPRASSPSEPYVLSSAIRRHKLRGSIETKVRYCLNFFPELDGRTFGIGLTRQAQGLASLEDFAIWLNPWQLSLQTISHEFTHLLQAKRLVPTGERSCDLFSLARHPSLNDVRPNYLDLPDTVFDQKDRTRWGWSGILYESARRAIRERSEGRRRYIRWFEDHMASLSRAVPIDFD